MRIDAGFAEDLIKKARRRGADLAEVYIKSAAGLSVEVKEQVVDSLTSSRSAGYSLRVVKGGRLGFSFATDTGSADRVVDDAVTASESADEDCYADLPGPAPETHVNVFDPAVDSLTEEDAINRVMDMERAVHAQDGRVRRVRKAMGSFAVSETVIVNSRSVRVSYKSTSCAAQVTAVAEEAGESQIGWEYDSSRFLGDIAFAGVGRNAAQRAVRLLGSRKISGCKAHVILDNSVTGEFLGIFASSLSSEAVQKGKSLLAGRLGSQVVSSKLNLIDSGALPGRAGSSPVDAEGVPTREKVLIREGVLAAYLYNTYTARRDSVESTGNAVRGGFSSLPSVGVTNLFLDAASEGYVVQKKRLFMGIDKGLYVVDAMGVHTANPVSGEFSVGVTGMWIEGGELKHPVKEAVISGNILDFFSRVESVGDDLRFYGNIGAPSMVISGVDISG